ncbi:hypothetical protein ACQPZG_32085 [Streptomyces sp. CA-294286]|uniref:hypothetical protein n=1 Tax=Streptomyces sp. CA-294286 TaxID=3240070 RepID=UPI003D9224A0
MTAPTLTPPTPQITRQDRSDVVLALRRELAAAGLASLGPDPMPTSSDPAEPLRLDRISLQDAAELTRLLHRAQRPAYKAAKALRLAAEAHRLRRFPTPTVLGGQIHLGSVPVPTGDRLATLLGAPPWSSGMAAEDIAEWHEAEPLLDRLQAAFRAATGGRRMELDFEPYCARGCGEALVVLGPLDVATARRLVKVLQYGVREEPAG